jgi:large conductance mechanosensitive channel
MLQEFRDFIMKGNILEIAIGLVLALYFQVIIGAVLDGMIYPVIAAIFGEPNFQNIGFDIGDSGARIRIGLVLNAIISFLIVAFVLFLIMRATTSMKKKDEAAAPSGPSDNDLLTEIRDSLRNR